MAGRLVNLPNILSLARIVVMPLLAIFIYKGMGWEALGVLLVAAATDWADGWLARRMKQETAFGKLLDPVADKIFLCVAVIFLLERPEKTIGPTLACLLLTREFLVTGLRAMAASEGLVIAAGQTGKLKTVGQFFGLGALMIQGEITLFDARLVGLVALWISVVLSYLSMIQYIMNVYRGLKSKIFQ
jgi:CDP-diacylglycerol--glycerol-3-phosphate 3-phosphatidyltransferase